MAPIAPMAIAASESRRPNTSCALISRPQRQHGFTRMLAHLPPLSRKLREIVAAGRRSPILRTSGLEQPSNCDFVHALKVFRHAWLRDPCRCPQIQI